MRKASFVLSAALAAAGLATVGTAMWPVAAVAQQKVSAEVGADLKKAQDAIGRKNWNGALAAINKAQGVSSRTAYDNYKINELLWYVYLQQGRNADAARLLEQQIASGQMPPSERMQRTKTLAQLYFRAGNYGKAIETGNAYLKSAPGDREVQMMVAQGYYQQKSYKNAIAAAQRLTSGGQPSEDLLQLVLRSNYELGDKAGTAKALEQLLRYYPTPQTWKSLLKTYFNQAKRDPELLALYRLSQDVGAMEEGMDYIDMAEALIVSGFAAEGQRVLEKGIEVKAFSPEEQKRVDRTLAAAKRGAASQTGALAAAAKAVTAGASGEDMYEAGKLYFSAGNYAKSAEALRKALAKGGLSDADDANMLLGIAFARSNRNGDAVKAFDAVKEPKFAEIARVWKLHAS